jgi:hypothetical protein
LISGKINVGIFIMNQKEMFQDFSKISSAVLSADRQYRYLLERQWCEEGKTVAFICLNPSTADENVDDPTVRRCVNFAKSWGGNRLLIGNIFAYRSTDPRFLQECLDPIGPDNENWLQHIAEQSDILIAAWGMNGKLLNRGRTVLERFPGKFSALRLTSDGNPGHPLYLPNGLSPFAL